MKLRSFLFMGSIVTPLLATAGLLPISGVHYFRVGPNGHAENLSKKDILRCLKRAIAREIHHVLLHRTTPERTDLRALRTQKRITLTHAAQALQTKPAHLSEIERRTRPQPALTTRYQKWLTAA